MLTVPVRQTSLRRWWTTFYIHVMFCLPTHLMKMLLSDCKRETDMVFVLDSSGSISDSDFDLSLDFAARVVEAMSIPEPLRVAALIYASSPVIEFNFSKEQTSPGVAAAIRGIRRGMSHLHCFLYISRAVPDVADISSLNTMQITRQQRHQQKYFLLTHFLTGSV